MFKRVSVTVLIFLALIGLLLLTMALLFAPRIVREYATGTGFIGEVHVTSGTPTEIAVAFVVVFTFAAFAYWLAGRVMKV